MTVDEIYLDITEHRPLVIYISGKTSTGKSTFGRRLRDNLGYQVIELEAVLLEIVKDHNFDEQTTFRKVLYDTEEFEAQTLFFNATDRIISDALTSNRAVVIEGAVANTETLQRILRPVPDPFFLYFHPDNIEVYIRNLTSRFMESSEESYGGLPLKFWQLIDKEEFKSFCKTRELTESLKESIKKYALISQNESLTRLAEFRKKFENIIVTEIL